MSNSKFPILGADLLYSAARTPGPLGRKDAADPSNDMCYAGDTPSALGAGADFASVFRRSNSSNIRCLVFDLPAITNFFHSVGQAISRQLHIRVEWKNYNSTGLMSLLYYLVDSQPGTATVVEGQKIEIEERANAEASRMLSMFLKKCSEGPREAIAYLENAAKVRQDAIQAVQDAFEDAIEINEGILQELNRRIRFAGTVKFGSDLVITVMSLNPAVGLASVGVSFAYSIAKDLVEGKEADTVIVDRGGAAIRDTAIQIADDAVIPKDVKEMGRWSAEAKIMEHEEQIAKYEQKAIGKKTSKQAKYKTRIKRHQAAKARLEKATSATRRGAGKALKGLSILFAAKDVIDSARELHEIFEKTK